MAQLKVNAMSYAKLVKELHDGPYSFAELAENIGLHYHTVRDYVNAMHREGLVHIVSWDKDSYGRDCKPLWTFGPGKDKRRARMTQAERQQRHRAKKRSLDIMHKLASMEADK